MAPRARMTPFAPVNKRYLWTSSGENRSPEPKIGILIRPVSINLFTVYHLAGTRLSSAAVRGWIDIQWTPASYIERTYLRVSSKFLSTLILQDTLIVDPNLSTSAFIILLAFWISFISALPIPPYVENFLGQPMFTSTPEISYKSFSTAWTAVSELQVPICNMKWSFSSFLRRRTRP